MRCGDDLKTSIITRGKSSFKLKHENQLEPNDPLMLTAGAEKSTVVKETTSQELEP